MGEAVLDVVQEWRGKGGGVSSGFEPAKALVRGLTATPTANLPQSRLENFLLPAAPGRGSKSRPECRFLA